MKKKYIAFIDVLGFSNLVKSSNKKRLENYFTLVQKAFGIFDGKKVKIQKLMISDSIILIADDSEAEFTALLQAIRTLQRTLAIIGVWVRGGIAYGEVFFENDVIVGEGFIRAVSLEDQAIYPRVIIDPSILSKFNLNRHEFYNKFNKRWLEERKGKLLHNYNSPGGQYRTTPDDAVFVCYANLLALNARDKNKRKFFEAAYKSIKANLYGPQEYFHKYSWLRQYFYEVLLEVKAHAAKENSDYRTWLSEKANEFQAL